MIIDILCIGSMAIGFWMGYSRGIIKTVFGVLSLFFGLLVALKFAPVTTNLLERLFGGESVLIFLMGFVLTFVAIMLLVRVLAKGLEKLMTTIKLNFINKFAGGALFSMVMVILFSILVWFFDRGGLIEQSTKNASISYPTLVQLPAASQSMLEKVKPIFKEFWEDTERMLDGIKTRNS